MVTKRESYLKLESGARKLLFSGAIGYSTSANCIHSSCLRSLVRASCSIKGGEVEVVAVLRGLGGGRRGACRGRGVCFLAHQTRLSLVS